MFKFLDVKFCIFHLLIIDSFWRCIKNVFIDMFLLLLSCKSYYNKKYEILIYQKYWFQSISIAILQSYLNI